MNPGKLLSQHILKNGLVLEFWDLSRPGAGDRWQVVVEARVAVAVATGNLPPEMRSQSHKIIAALGAEVGFIKQEVRHFVAAGDMPALLGEIQDQLNSSLSGYLGHPEFAARFIRRKYADYQESSRY